MSTFTSNSINVSLNVEVDSCKKIKMESLGSIAETAEFREYALESKRLESFTHWPKALKQKPDQLADAGFFYTGRGDRVVCFSCGGGLWQWEENDDVWEEHASHYGECKYLRLCKGDNFSEEVLDEKLSNFIAKLKDSNLLEPKKEEEEEEKLECSETSNECQICCVNKYNTVFLPCGHVFACVKCASPLQQCPLCRKRIVNVMKIFLPQ